MVDHSDLTLYKTLSHVLMHIHTEYDTLLMDQRH